MPSPRLILVEDQDGGYILAEWKDTKENADEEFIEVYEYKQYYHHLEDALRDFKRDIK